MWLVDSMSHLPTRQRPRAWSFGVCRLAVRPSSRRRPGQNIGLRYLGLAALLATVGAAVAGEDAEAHGDCAAGLIREVKVKSVTEAARLAFLIEVDEAEAPRARDLVDELYAPEHVYILYATPPSPGGRAPSAVSDWIRERRYANVFAAPEPRPAEGAAGGLTEVAARAARRILEHHPDWDYLVDLPRGISSLLPVGALSRWLGGLNGTSLIAQSRPIALARGHVSEIFQRLRAGSPAQTRQLWATARAEVSTGGSEAWAHFWTSVLAPGSCGEAAPAEALSVFFARPQKNLRPALEASASQNPTSWAVVSPVDAYDAGHRFDTMGDEWMSLHSKFVQWILHALFVHRSKGEQRVSGVKAVARRAQDRVVTGRRSRLTSPPPAERYLRAAEQLSVRAVFAPADGICKVRGASGMLFQLSDCSREAEVFLMERLFVTRPVPSLSELCTASCAAVASPTLLRVGTGWDGDSEVFKGFVSILPSTSAGDLWLVLYFLGPHLGQDAGKSEFITEWLDPEGEALFRGGGSRIQLPESAARGQDHSAGDPPKGIAWERYAGPTPLEVGSHSVVITDGEGRIIARRTFEVVGDPSAMEAADRLAIFPRYFDLVPEPGARAGMDKVHGLPPTKPASPAEEQMPTSAPLQPTRREPGPSLDLPPKATTPEADRPPRRRSLEEIRAARAKKNSAPDTQPEVSEEILKKAAEVEAKAAEESKKKAAQEAAKKAAEEAKKAAEEAEKLKAAQEAKTKAAEVAARRVAEEAKKVAEEQEEKMQAHIAATEPPTQAATPLGTRLRRPRLSDEEARRREIEWIRRDVAQFAVAGANPHLTPSDKEPAGKRPRRKPLTAEEFRRRELAWIQQDVALHAPAAQTSTSTVRSSADKSSTQGGPPWPVEERERREQLWIQSEAQRIRQNTKTSSSRSDPTHADKPVPSRSDPTPAYEPAPDAKGAAKEPVLAAKGAVKATLARSSSSSRSRPRSREEWAQREEEWLLQDVRRHAHLRNPQAQLRFCNKGSPELAATEAVGAKKGNSDSVERELDELEWVTQEVKKAKQLADQSPAPPSKPPPAQAAREPPIVADGVKTAPMDANASLRAAALKAGLPEDIAAEVKAKLRGQIPDDVMDRELPWLLQDIAVGRKLMKQ